MEPFEVKLDIKEIMELSFEYFLMQFVMVSYHNFAFSLVIFNTLLFPPHW